MILNESSTTHYIVATLMIAITLTAVYLALKMFRSMKLDKEKNSLTLIIDYRVFYLLIPCLCVWIFANGALSGLRHADRAAFTEGEFDEVGMAGVSSGFFEKHNFVESETNRRCEKVKTGDGRNVAIFMNEGPNGVNTCGFSMNHETSTSTSPLIPYRKKGDVVQIYLYEWPTARVLTSHSTSL